MGREIFNEWNEGDKALITRVVTSGTTVTEYIAEAPRGSKATEAVWRARKIVRKTVNTTTTSETVTYCVGLVNPGTDGANLPSRVYV